MKWKHLAFILLVLMTAAPSIPFCEQSLEIVEPQDGAELNTIEEIVITYSEGVDESTLNVLVNGEPITQFFDIGPTEARVAGEEVVNILRQGQNVLSAVAQTENGTAPPSDTVTFFFDSKAPRIMFDALTTNEQTGEITLSGTITDTTEITTFTINDVAPERSDSSFTVTLPDTNLLHVLATDRLGNTLDRIFARPGTRFESGLLMRVMEGTLAFFVPQLESDLAAVPLFDRMPVPVAQGQTDTGTPPLPTDYTATVTSLAHDPATVDFLADDQRPATLVTRATYPNITIGLTVEMTRDGQNTTANVTMAIPQALIEDRITVGTDGIYFVGQSHSYAVTLGTVTLSGDPLPPEIEPLIESAVSDALSAVLVSVAEDLFPPFVDATLAAISYDTQAEITLSGQSFTIQMNATANMLITENEGATFHLDSLNHTDSFSPDVSFVPGSIFTPSDPPELPALTPIDGLVYDFAVSLSDDWFNQYVYHIYDNGTFDYEENTTVSALLGDIIPQEILDLLPGDDLRILLYMEDTPSIGFDFPGETTVIYMPRMQMDAFIKDDDTGEYILFFSVNLDATLPATVEILDGGASIFFVFSETGMISLNTIQVGRINLPTALIEDMVNAILPEFLPRIGDSIGVVPIPTIEGVTVLLVELAPDGPDLDYLTIFSILQ